MPQQQTILLVDDDPDQLELTQAVLVRAGHRVRTTTSPLQALAMLDGVALVVTDFQMPEMSGVALCDRIKSVAPKVVVIVVTGSGINVAASAMRAGAWDFLMKPVEPKLLLAATRQALRRSSATALETST
ncbi:MAG: response regulator [Deltaproteobacteria bacterium]|nr:response regulator [Deltaproteobacteria bacterium]